MVLNSNDQRNQMEVFSQFKIVLASQSPRRKELLQNMGFEFGILSIRVDESYPPNILPDAVPLFLANKKFDVAARLLDDNHTIIITADTMVICEGEIIGKPMDKYDAFSKIQMLSGRDHKVITGVCIGNKSERILFDDTSIVSVDKVSDDETSYYISNFEVMDKAGAYGIQDWLGLAKISCINGSYTNVIGLPTQKLWIKIHEFVEKYR